LPMSVARSSSGMLIIGRIAYRRKVRDGSAQRGRCVIYDCPVTARSELRKILFWAVLALCFVCVRNILGTAERICAKLTEKTCFVPRSDEFEGQGQKSKVKVTRDKNGIFGPFGGPCAVYVW